MTKISKPSVLIVGAGPSGLMMAHELKRFNIDVEVVEKDLQKSVYSRAIAVQVRTLEIFSSLGLLEHLLKKAQNSNAVQIYTEGCAPISFPLEPTSSYFSGLTAIEQPHTEEVLEEANVRLEIPVTRGVELVDFTRNEEGVRVSLRNTNGEMHHKTFTYLVGADGAHSTVRQQMSDPFLGSTYDDAFILADAYCEHPFDHHTIRLFFKNKLLLVLLPLFPDGHYRLISVRLGETKKAGPKPTIEEFRALAKKLVPFPFEIIRSTWVSRFFVQCRSVKRYQEGSVFLIGDAAHIHSPAGGQGMNTGLQDAFNLAWKMAMVLKNRAKPALLETYHHERKPVGDFLLNRTDRLFKFMVRSSVWARLARLIVLPCVARVRALRAQFALIASQTAIRYENGALCSHHHENHADVKIGARLKNFSLAMSDGRQTDVHTVTRDLHFTLLVVVPHDVSRDVIEDVTHRLERATKQFDQGLLGLLLFTENPHAHQGPAYAVINKGTFTNKDPFYVIVRPDHHVYCAGVLTEWEHGIESLKTFLLERTLCE